MVTEPVAFQVNDRVKIDWEKFRKLARLCPECRRKKAAESVAMVALKKED